MKPALETASTPGMQRTILLVSGVTNVGFVSEAEYLAEQGHHVSVLLEEMHPGAEHLGTGTWERLWSSGAVHVRSSRSGSPLARRIRWALEHIPAALLLLRLWKQSRISDHEFPSGVASRALTAWTTRRIRELAANHDVVHVRDGAPARRVAAALELFESPACLTVSFLGLDLTSLAADERRRRYAGVFARAETLTVATRFMEGQLVQGGAPTDRIAIVPHTIDIKQCPRRQRRFAEDGVIRLVSVGRLIELKGFRYSILATKSLRERSRSVQLAILGSGPLEESLRALAQELNISDHVDFFGRLSQSDTYERMAEADILLHPALTIGTEAEAMGLVSLEAQQIGLHVITTRSGGLPETVVEAVSGIVVPERDPSAIAAAVEAIAAEREDERAARVAAGRAHVRHNFSIQSQGHAWLSILSRPSQVHRNLGD